MGSHPDCAYLGCPEKADWALYPPKRRAELAVHLCNAHRTEAMDNKAPRQELYASANSLVRASLNVLPL